MLEIWKQTVGFNDYQVSNLGNVRTFKKNKCFILKTYKNHAGYRRVHLFKEGKKYNLRVSRLVATAFHGKSDLQVDHIDNDKQNDCADNLRWVTVRVNVVKSIDKSKTSSGYTGVSWHKQSKKWTAQITVNSKRIHLGVFQNEAEAARTYADALAQIKKSRSRRSGKHKEKG